MTTITTLPEQRLGLPVQDRRVVVAPRNHEKPRSVRMPQGTRTGWAMRVAYLLSDLIAFSCSIALAELVVAAALGHEAAILHSVNLRVYLLWGGGLVAAAAVQETYAAIPPRPVRKFRGWVFGASAVCIAVVGAAWSLGVSSLARDVTLVIATSLAILVASFCRALSRIVFGRASWWGTRLLVVGNGEAVARAYADMEREPQWGLRPVGFLHSSGADEATMTSPHCLGPLDHLDQLAEEFNVVWGLIALSSFRGDELADLLSRAAGRIKHWIILPPLEPFPSLWLEACEAVRRPALSVTNRLALAWAMPVKRAFDLVITTVLAILALPLIVLIAVLVRASSPGSIFYGQERVGRFGHRFKAWKFRTMLPNADAVLSRYLEQHPSLAAEWKANHKMKHDPRITWIGRWLRSTSLDELPQIWNVLMGEMSLVGPRPIVDAEIGKYGDEYECYVKVPPGITGLWQVSGRNNTTYAERVALDVYYVHNWSLWLDVYILACTAKVVLLREGAY